MLQAPSRSGHLTSSHTHICLNLQLKTPWIVIMKDKRLEIYDSLLLIPASLSFIFLLFDKPLLAIWVLLFVIFVTILSILTLLIEK